MTHLGELSIRCNIIITSHQRRGHYHQCHRLPPPANAFAQHRAYTTQLKVCSRKNITKSKVKLCFTVGILPDQLNHIDELSRSRSRKRETINRAVLVREAVGFYLQHQPDVVGSRKAIARDLQAKIDALDGKVETLAQR
jgi:hypothetical protein